MLPNNSAWATKLPYKNKKEQIVLYTDCKAVENGWIWTIPLWSRIGTGYVYSDNFIDDDAALKQFQKHLGTDEAEFRKIKMRIGIHENIWEKNVVAIGLSAGFIEPLESNGLFTVHQFLKELIRNLKRDKISQWDRDNFTYTCKWHFRGMAEFVALHYILSHRDDTEYWKRIQNKSWLVENNWQSSGGPSAFFKLLNSRVLGHNFNDYPAIAAIATGMHYSPTELSEEMWSFFKTEDMLVREWEQQIANLNERRNRWKLEAEKSENTYDFLKRYIYKEE